MADNVAATVPPPRPPRIAKPPKRRPKKQRQKVRNIKKSGRAKPMIQGR